jgi:hypothetical protein
MIFYAIKRWRKSRAKKQATTTSPCEHRSEPAPEPCVECEAVTKADEAAAKAATRYRLKLIAGLFFPFSLAALDATMYVFVL